MRKKDQPNLHTNYDSSGDCQHCNAGYCRNPECWNNTRACRFAQRFQGKRPENVMCESAL